MPKSGDVAELSDESWNTHASMPGARFVDPKVLARIGNLELLARNVVDGFINGLHRAPFFGASIDFAEHRGYVAGRRHPPRRLAAVRAHRPLLRQAVRGRHEHELRRSCSTSRGRWGSRAAASRSSSTAAIVGACLAYLAQRQRDRVGLITFDSDIVTHVPPSAKHFNVVLHTLERAKAERPGQPRGAAPQDGGALQAPRHPRADLGLLRGAGRDPRGDQAAASSSATI